MPHLFNMAVEGEAAQGLAAAVAALRSGHLVGMPTETVYGLAANAADPRAVAGIFAAKGRPRFNPLIVHVPDLGAAGRLAVLGPLGERLAAAFWPGPLTLVAPALPGNGIADLVSAGLPTLALRVPAHPVAHAVLKASGLPLAAPSANRSGHVSATSAAHVVADLGDAVAVVLDAGTTRLGLESTIIDVAADDPVLLRAGAIARGEIEAVLGRRLASPAVGLVTAPGMLQSHYAPAVPLRLGATSVYPGESVLAFGAAILPGADQAAALWNLSPAGDLREAATNLFAALRDLEALGAPIAVVAIPDRDLGEAINDRLRRAASPR